MTMPDTMPPEASDDMVRATRRGRACATVLVLCLIALIAAFQLFVFPLLNNTLAADPSIQNIQALKWILAGCSASGILPALYMIITGWKTRRNGRFPLAGAWVVLDTRIKRGTEAMRIGAFCIAVGIVAGMLCISAIVYIWIMFDRLIPERTLRQGVIILQQTPGAKP